MKLANYRKTNIIRLLLNEVSKVIKFIEKENKMMVARDGGGGENEELFKEYSVPLMQEKKL